MNNVKSKKKILDLKLRAVKDIEGQLVWKKQVEKRLLQDLNTGLEFGFAIALPLVGGALLGSYLDKRLGVSPKVTLSLIFLGMVISGFYLYKIIRNNIKE